MLEIALATLISLSATCDAGSAAAGGCGCGASGSSFTICATKTTTAKTQPSTPVKTAASSPKQTAKPKAPAAAKVITPAKAKTVTNPTSCQEIWNVGKSATGCSKPKSPVPTTVKKKTPAKPVVTTPAEIETTQSFDDQASAMVPTPRAFWYPGGTITQGSTAYFEVLASESQAALELFGEPASIRFVPIMANWDLAGATISGFSAAQKFDHLGEYRAQAFVTYRVDYQLPGEAWVVAAAEIISESNELFVTVVDPPRRTLLVG